MNNEIQSKLCEILSNLTFSFSLSDSTESALIAGFLAGGFSLFGVMLAWNRQEKHSNKLQNEQVKAFLQAIEDEITIVFSRHMKESGTAIEESKNTQALLFHFMAEEEYFSVYNQNVNLIGLINSKPLRTQLISTYTNAKSMMDSVKLNAQMTDELYRLEELFMNNKANEIHDRILSHKISMSQLANTLRNEQQQIRQDIDKLKQLIPQYINKK